MQVSLHGWVHAGTVRSRPVRSRAKAIRFLNTPGVSIKLPEVLWGKSVDFGGFGRILEDLGGLGRIWEGL